MRTGSPQVCLGFAVSGSALRLRHTWCHLVGAKGVVFSSPFKPFPLCSLHVSQFCFSAARLVSTSVALHRSHGGGELPPAIDWEAIPPPPSRCDFCSANPPPTESNPPPPPPDPPDFYPCHHHLPPSETNPSLPPPAPPDFNLSPPNHRSRWIEYVLYQHHLESYYHQLAPTLSTPTDLFPTTIDTMFSVESLKQVFSLQCPSQYVRCRAIFTNSTLLIFGSSNTSAMELSTSQCVQSGGVLAINPVIKSNLSTLIPDLVVACRAWPPSVKEKTSGAFQSFGWITPSDHNASSVNQVFSGGLVLVYLVCCLLGF